jgi:hypothetical protein
MGSLWAFGVVSFCCTGGTEERDLRGVPQLSCQRYALVCSVGINAEGILRCEAVLRDDALPGCGRVS